METVWGSIKLSFEIFLFTSLKSLSLTMTEFILNQQLSLGAIFIYFRLSLFLRPKSPYNIPLFDL